MNLTKLVTLTALTLATACFTHAADAKENWEKTCTKCHGPDGKGDTKMGKKLSVKDLSDAKVQSELSDDQAFKTIKDGVKDGDKTKMKPAENLTEADIKALVAHVRALKKK